MVAISYKVHYGTLLQNATDITNATAILLQNATKVYNNALAFYHKMRHF